MLRTINGTTHPKNNYKSQTGAECSIKKKERILSGRLVVK